MPTARRLLAVILLGVLALEAVGPAAAAIPSGRYAIGDSVMLGAKEELTARGIKVNAVVSRQFRDAVPLVRQLKDARRVGRRSSSTSGTTGSSSRLPTATGSPRSPVRAGRSIS